MRLLEETDTVAVQSFDSWQERDVGVEPIATI